MWNGMALVNVWIFRVPSQMTILRENKQICADKHVLSGDNTHLQWLSITFIMAAVYFPSQTPRLLHFWASHAYIASYLCTAHTHSITRSVHNSVRLINCGSRQCRKGKLKQTGTMRNQHRTWRWESIFSIFFFLRSLSLSRKLCMWRAIEKIA